MLQIRSREGRLSHDPQEGKAAPVVDDGSLSIIVTLTDIINYITEKIA
jgi:CBS domain-containing protein